MNENIVTYAGFWKRFLAYIIDSIIMSIVLGILFIPFWLIFGLGFISSGGFEEFEDFVNVNLFMQHFNDEKAWALFTMMIGFVIIISLISTIIQWLYFALMESSAKQATLGKLALAIKVTDLNGNRISFGRASGRYFAKIISGLIFCIGYIIAGFTEKKQALHDMIANCLVVNVN